MTPPAAVAPRAPNRNANSGGGAALHPGLAEMKQGLNLMLISPLVPGAAAADCPEGRDGRAREAALLPALLLPARPQLHSASLCKCRLSKLFKFTLQRYWRLLLLSGELKPALRPRGLGITAVTLTTSRLRIKNCS